MGVGAGDKEGEGDANGVVGMMVGVVRRENSMLAIGSPG